LKRRNKQSDRIENHPQGDVNRFPVTKHSPDAFRKPRKTVPVPGGQMILAYGEVTGHKHEVTGDAQLVMRQSDLDRIINTEDAADLERWLLVGKGGATITHEEHDTQTIAPGIYFIPGRQREYAPASAPSPSPTQTPEVRRSLFVGD
jgi:hypothetical protein